MRVFAATVVAVLVWSIAAGVAAQAPEALPEPGEMRLQLGGFRAIRRGQPAPDDGILVAADTLLRIQMDYDALAFRLGRERERAEARCLVQLDMERARTRAEMERLILRDGLWRDRERELREAVQQARQDAVRQWYENPGLWAGVGALVASLVAVLASQL